jgi:hypothetical protein
MTTGTSPTRPGPPRGVSNRARGRARPTSQLQALLRCCSRRNQRPAAQRPARDQARCRPGTRNRRPSGEFDGPLPARSNQHAVRVRRQPHLTLDAHFRAIATGTPIRGPRARRSRRRRTAYPRAVANGGRPSQPATGSRIEDTAPALRRLRAPRGVPRRRSLGTTSRSAARPDPSHPVRRQDVCRARASDSASSLSHRGGGGGRRAAACRARGRCRGGVGGRVVGGLLEAGAVWASPSRFHGRARRRRCRWRRCRGGGGCGASSA